MDKEGYVYILTNPSFREDWVKIGKSSRSTYSAFANTHGGNIVLGVKKAVALIPIGFPADARGAKTRKALEEILR